MGLRVVSPETSSTVATDAATTAGAPPGYTLFPVINYWLFASGSVDCGTHKLGACSSNVLSACFFSSNYS